MMFSRYMRGMVYWAKLQNDDINSSVTTGIRPVIIVSNNIANCTSRNVTVVPCTTNTEKNLEQPTHTLVHFKKDTASLVLCEDITTINKESLAGFMGMLDNDTMMKVDKCLLSALGLCYVPNPFEHSNDNVEIQPSVDTQEEQTHNRR